MAVNWFPKGYQQVIPYLAVQGAGRIIPFAEKTLGAKVIEKHEGPGGRLMHAEIRIGECVVMLGEPEEERKGGTAMLMVYLPDVDDAYRRALAAGGTKEREPADQFYGDRTAGVKDPCGNLWYLATHIKDVSKEEMAAHMAESVKKSAKK